MLIGTTTNTVDEKGGLVLTPRWHADFASGGVITRGFEKCIVVFPKNQFDKIVSEVEKQGMAASIVRMFARHLVAEAEYVELDHQGQISMPQNLRAFAELERNVTIVGVINRLEIWNPQIFAQVDNEMIARAHEVSEKFAVLARQSF